MTRRLLCFFALAAALCGCIHSAPVPDEVKSSAPGFGSSERRPEALPLSLPTGIKMVDHEISHTGRLSTNSRDKLAQLPDQ